MVSPRTTIFVLAGCALILCRQNVLAIDGSPTGWWSDSDGNNYYGDPPSSSSSSSYSSSSYSSGSYSSSGNTYFDWEAHRQNQLAAEATSLNNTGNTFFNKGEYESSIPYYEQALEKNPNDAIIRENLHAARGRAFNLQGIHYYKQGDWDNAILYYKKALEQTPDDTVIQKNLAQAEAHRREEIEEKQRRAENLRQQKAMMFKAETQIQGMLDELTEEVTLAPLNNAAEIKKSNLKIKSTADSGYQSKSDHLKTFKLKEIPLPKAATEAEKKRKEQRDREAAQAKAERERRARREGFKGWVANKWDDGKKSSAKARKDFREWTEEKSKNFTIDQIWGVKKARDLGKSINSTFKSYKDIVLDFYHGATDGLAGKAKRLGDPDYQGDDDEKHEDQYRGGAKKGLDKSEKMGKGNIKDHL